MVSRGLVSKERLLGFFSEIEPALIRYPAIDPASFTQAVRAFVEKPEGENP